MAPNIDDVKSPISFKSRGTSKRRAMRNREAADPVSGLAFRGDCRISCEILQGPGTSHFNL